MVFGDKLFPMLGMQPPPIYEQIKDKKFAIGILTSALHPLKLAQLICVAFSVLKSASDTRNLEQADMYAYDSPKTCTGLQQ